ncbi:MAG: M23 family metallopeptidase [Christensenellaceae bacterium]|jgi:murein DD-endopeptidase MepM/ murein hydrolase activator NlpD|nr:M23 family metallopeptidase [Christensenellaceae bacterium]
MENNNNKGTSKAKAFLKKNVYYIIMGVCVLAIGAMITVAIITASKDKNSGGEPLDINPGDQPAVVLPDENNDTPTDIPGGNTDTPVVTPPAPIIFAVPANAEIARDFTITSLIKWESLNKFAVHTGIDFISEEDTDVFCAYNGTVIKVGSDLLNGNYVIIDHGNGLTTQYASLSVPEVTEGQTVAKGAKIATTSTTGTAEAELGNHCHFAVYLNGAAVSPYDYFTEGDK